MSAEGSVLLLRAYWQVLLASIPAGNTVLSGVRLEPAHDGVEAFGSLLSQTWSPNGAINGTHEMTDPRDNGWPRTRTEKSSNAPKQNVIVISSVPYTATEIMYRHYLKASALRWDHLAGQS